MTDAQNRRVPPSGVSGDASRSGGSRNTGRSSHRRQPDRSREPIKVETVGAVLVIACVVGVQFVDITLFTAGSFVVSAQKLVSILALPVGIFLMREVRVPRQLLVAGGLFILAFVVGPVLDAQNSDALADSLVALVLSIVAAAVLYTALLQLPGSLVLLARVWIGGAVLTACVALLQTVGLVPLVNVTDDLLARRETVAGLWRATGFKLDPNFAAMVLVVGLAFTCVVRRFQWRLVFTLAILGGIVATMSRMGIIVGALLIIVGLAPVPSRDPVKALFKRLAVAGVLVAGIAVLYQSSQGLVRSYIDNRLVDLQFGLGGLLTGDAGISSVGSATERSLLLEGTLEVVRQQPFFGVGPQNLQLLMYGITGVSGKGAHNTYLELLAIGGLFGAFALLAYVGFTWAALRRARSAAPHSGMWAPVRAVRLACLAMAMMALVLTVSYNAILWLPLALALASDELARSRSALVSRSTNPSDIADGVQS